MLVASAPTEFPFASVALPRTAFAFEPTESVFSAFVATIFEDVVL